MDSKRDEDGSGKNIRKNPFKDKGFAKKIKLHHEDVGRHSANNDDIDMDSKNDGFSISEIPKLPLEQAGDTDSEDDGFLISELSLLKLEQMGQLRRPQEVKEDENSTRSGNYTYVCKNCKATFKYISVYRIHCLSHMYYSSESECDTSSEEEPFLMRKKKPFSSRLEVDFNGARKEDRKNPNDGNT